MNIMHREIRTPISESEFCSWLRAAAPGNVIEYHRGFLVLDAAQPCRGILKPERNGAYSSRRSRLLGSRTGTGASGPAAAGAEPLCLPGSDAATSPPLVERISADHG